MMYTIRIFEEKDFQQVLALVSDIIVNDFHFKLELQEGGLDSDLLHIKERYNKSSGCFWVAEDNNKIVGTTGIRKLAQFHQPTCELKRMYVSKPYRRVGIAQKMLDTAIEFAGTSGYSRIFLDSSRWLTAARSLYLKNGFVDIERYNDNYRADVFMQKQL
jgi:putative acetyltransferase